MLLAHAGVAVFIIGVGLVKGYETERDVRMAIGDKATLGGYEFAFIDTKDVAGPNYRAIRGTFEVRKEGAKEVDRTLFPEKRTYTASGQTMTEAAIDAGFVRDLYVSLGEPVDDSGRAWGVRIYRKPFVNWIWGGCALMALGGFIAIADRRYRAKRPATVPEGVAAGARA